MSKIVVHKINAVHCRVVCPDTGTAMELSEYFTFTVPGHQFMPKYKSGVWDGKIRLYNPYKQVLYAGLIPYTQKFAKERGYEIELMYDDSAENVPFNVTTQFAENIVKEANIDLELRKYQVGALTYAARDKRGLYVSATSSGKSLIMYMIARWFNKKTLIIVPRVGLSSQLLGDFADYGLDTDKYVHVVRDGVKKSDKLITISTWQAIYKEKKDFFKDFEVVLGDEVHEFEAASTTGIMEKLVNAHVRLGFTGTLKDVKTHRLVLTGLFGEVRDIARAKDLIEQGYISKPKIKCIVLSHGDDERRINRPGFTYEKEIQFIIGNAKRNAFIKNLALSIRGNTLVLFQRIEAHGDVLFDMIKKDAGDKEVFFIAGRVDSDDREVIRKRIDTLHESITVASYGTFSMGTNIKLIDNIIFASPYKSKVKVLQSIGRGLRKTEKKNTMTLYDISDDLMNGSRVNTTLKHLRERTAMYDSEEFEYKVYKVKI